VDVCQIELNTSHSLEKAAQNIGLPVLNDCNDPGAPLCGYFTLETSIDRNGGRVSALSAYLNKSIARERSKRLIVCTGTVASRLQIAGDEQNGRMVTAVYIRSSARSNTAKDYLVKARREVVLTCGAINTPQLLLLSGIGPTGPDTSASKLNIPIVKELPVGANFSDHYSIPIMLELPIKETLHFLETAMWGLWYILVWIFTGKGLLSVSSAPAAIFFHTDSVNDKSMEITTPNKSHGQVPNVEIMIIPLNSLERAVPGRSLFSIYPTIVQPQAKGEFEFFSTHIKARNPY
jgi:choline dehydrogenase-like flavoprotein